MSLGGGDGSASMGYASTPSYGGSFGMTDDDYLRLLRLQQAASGGDTSQPIFLGATSTEPASSADSSSLPTPPIPPTGATPSPAADATASGSTPVVNKTITGQDIPPGGFEIKAGPGMQQAEPDFWQKMGDALRLSKGDQKGQEKKQPPAPPTSTNPAYGQMPQSRFGQGQAQGLAALINLLEQRRQALQPTATTTAQRGLLG